MTVRKSPPVCIFVSLLKLIAGSLRLSKKYLNHTIEADNSAVYTIFRHITVHPARVEEPGVVFIVRFRFSRLSHRANKFASIVPMLMIAGFPGFIVKIYSVDFKSGYWQGMYQWRSMKNLEEYKQSLVFGMMKKRAERGTLLLYVREEKNLLDYIDERSASLSAEIDKRGTKQSNEQKK